MIIPLLLTLIAAVVAVTIHESCKALVATMLGDPGPRMQRRLTLNPLRHVEPVGLICFMIFRLGWGKPMKINSQYFKNPLYGSLLVHLAPSVVNLLFGIVAAAASPFVVFYLDYVAYLSISLAFFALVPVYPMNGSAILKLFVSPNTVVKLSTYEKILQLLMLVALYFGLFQKVIFPITSFLINSVQF